jgi:ferredoxin
MIPCENTVIQFARYPQLKVCQTKKSGFGLKTLETIKEDTIICEYRGEVINIEESFERMATYQATDGFYFAALGTNDLVLDASKMGSLARFANHSCDPNSYLQRFTVLGESRIVLIANETIPTGKEITYSYNFNDDGFVNNPINAQICYCGSKFCTGTVGGVSTIRHDINDTCHYLDHLLSGEQKISEEKLKEKLESVELIMLETHSKLLKQKVKQLRKLFLEEYPLWKRQAQEILQEFHYYQNKKILKTIQQRRNRSMISYTISQLTLFTQQLPLLCLQRSSLEYKSLVIIIGSAEKKQLQICQLLQQKYDHFHRTNANANCTTTSSTSIATIETVDMINPTFIWKDMEEVLFLLQEFLPLMIDWKQCAQDIDRKEDEDCKPIAEEIIIEEIFKTIGIIDDWYRSHFQGLLMRSNDVSLSLKEEKEEVPVNQELSLEDIFRMYSLNLSSLSSRYYSKNQMNNNSTDILELESINRLFLPILEVMLEQQHQHDNIENRFTEQQQENNLSSCYCGILCSYENLHRQLNNDIRYSLFFQCKSCQEYCHEICTNSKILYEQNDDQVPTNNNSNQNQNHENINLPMISELPLLKQQLKKRRKSKKKNRRNFQSTFEVEGNNGTCIFCTWSSLQLSNYTLLSLDEFGFDQFLVQEQKQLETLKSHHKMIINDISEEKTNKAEITTQESNTSQSSITNTNKRGRSVKGGKKDHQQRDKLQQPEQIESPKEKPQKSSHLSDFMFVEAATYHSTQLIHSENQQSQQLAMDIRNDIPSLELLKNTVGTPRYFLTFAQIQYMQQNLQRLKPLQVSKSFEWLPYDFT